MSDKKTILLVEDEALIAVAQKKILEKNGYRAIAVHSGEKAIEKVRTTPDIDLILMDINLGRDKMDGTECSEIILREKDIPVLFLSSYTQPEIVERTERIASYGYVVKDSGETVLNASIKMAFKLYGAHRELKKREEALREGEAKYRGISEDMPVLICRFLPDYTITYVNRTFCDHFGKRPDELVGTSFLALIPAPNHDAVKTTISSLTIDAPEVSKELQVIMPDQTVGWQKWINTALFDGTGHIAGYRSIGEDITERKRTEEELREMAERLRLANKATNDVIWDWDVIQDTQRWNEAGTAVFGWTEIVEHPVNAHWWVERVYPGDRDRVHDTFFAVVNNPEIDVWHDEYRFLKTDGTYADVLDRGYVLRDEQGKAIRMIGAMLDITGRKRFEETLATSLREKEVLLKEIHHRVKNNLQVVSSILNLQSEKVKDLNTRDLLEDCRKRIQVMSLVHNRLYRSTDLARIGSREYLEDLLADIACSYGGRGGGVTLCRDIEEMSFDIDTAIPLGLLVNELITNAFKHAFPGDRKGTVAVTLRKRNDSVLLTVRDDGAGFPEGLDFACTESLGMQLVVSLAEQIGGVIDMSSRNGTSFTVAFPHGGSPHE